MYLCMSSLKTIPGTCEVKKVQMKKPAATQKTAPVTTEAVLVVKASMK